MLLCIPHGHQETEDTAGTEEEWGTVLGQGWVGGELWKPLWQRK